MNQSSRPAEVPVGSSELLQKRLNKYALAASAAGVGVLALTQSAEAKIIYTPTHRVINAGQHYNLDLNHDGKTDFSIQNYSNTFEGSQQGFLFVDPAQEINGVDGGAVYKRAFALKPDTPIGPKAHFDFVSYISMISADAAERCFGYWNNVKNRYLGLKFVVKGKTHFGWARMSASCDSVDNKIKTTLTGYAYETVANKAIIAGKTKGPDVITVPAASLGQLARGASAVSSRGRNQTARNAP